jgi:type VI secretion system protein ImpC
MIAVKKELSDLGFIPLVHCKITIMQPLWCAQSVLKKAKTTNDDANVPMRCCRLSCTHHGSINVRSQYLKAMMRMLQVVSYQPGNVESF